jgi:hypothetical protein
MKPMDVVKKNLVSILCGVAALAAVVFYFVGAQPKFATLEKEMTDRLNKPKEAQALLAAERKLPVVKEGVTEKLQWFPNRKTIDVAGAVVTQLQKQASDVMAQAVAINRAGRQLLVEGTLPRPRDQPIAYKFREAYVEVFKRGGRPDPTWTKTVNLPDGVLRSAEPPTEAEIAAAKLKLWQDEYVPQVIITDNQPRNLKEIAADFVKATENFDQEFRRKRASEHKVYLEPFALAQSATMTTATAQAPSPAEMWYAQMALWVQQDVCTAIAALNDSNAAFKDIPTAPVKHLLSLDMQPALTMYVTMGATPAAPAPSADGPAGGGGAATDPSVKHYGLSPTGRVSNSLYDVVQFRLNVVVDADSVRSLIQQLQYGRFMSVLEVDVKGVDLDQALDEGYGYGKRPVVEVKLRCEALFLRDWTAWEPQPKRQDGAPMPPKQGPMPLEVQRLLGIAMPNQERPADAAPVALN